MTAPGPLIIAVAPNGSSTRKADNPAVPYSAREIADEIVRAAEAGAAIAHVHARMADGTPTQEADAFRAIVDLVRARSDIILELSLGSPGFSVEDAVAPLALHPAMASFPMQARKDAASGGASLDGMTRMLLARGVRPSLAITSADTQVMVLDLIARDLAGAVPCLVVGVDPFDGVGDAASRLVGLTKDLPDRVHWWVMKGGKSGAAQYALRALAIGLGGHVRVGFEDTVTKYDASGPAPSNAWFVERIAGLAGAMGRPVATPGQAREMLGLT